MTQLHIHTTCWGGSSPNVPRSMMVCKILLNMLSLFGHGEVQNGQSCDYPQHQCKSHGNNGKLASMMPNIDQQQQVTRHENTKATRIMRHSTYMTTQRVGVVRVCVSVCLNPKALKTYHKVHGERATLVCGEIRQT